MNEHDDDKEKVQFYMQICAALIRQVGGGVIIKADEFSNPATTAIMHRRSPEFDGIEVVVNRRAA